MAIGAAIVGGAASGLIGGLFGKSSKSSKSTSTSRVDRAPASPQELALTDIAKQQWNDYVARFMPLNTELLNKYRSDYNRDVQPAIGRAEADTRIAASGQARRTLHEAMSGGARAGSGRALMAGADQSAQLGKTLGEAQGGAYRNAYDQEFVGLQKLAAQGRDIQDSSVTSMAEAGNRATREAIARASRSSSSSGSSRSGSDWGSGLASAAGAATRLATDYIFGTPKPSWESGVTPGNKTWYGSTYYDPANDFNAPATSGGGFSDWVSNTFGGSSGGSGWSTGDSIYLDH